MAILRRQSQLLALFILAAFVLPAYGQQADSGQSLADMARKLRKDKTTEVQMTEADTKRLFQSVDTILTFAAEDSGMPRRTAVKRQLVGKSDVEKYVTGRLAKEEFTQRFVEEELSMKKLGFLPRDFNLKEFLVKSTGQEIAGFYDEETKTISLLNWVPVDQQEPILAHELTHALQDQNYDLGRWMKAGTKTPSSGAHGNATDDGTLARKAAVEGQAMVVYVDYMLRRVGRSLEDTPGLIYQMEDPVVKGTVDSQLMHEAPMIMREAGTFAYKEGLVFEGELLHKGGKKMAFAGVFLNPPRNTHEVLHPEAYMQGDKLPPIHIPDMRQALNGQYEVYDSGGIGELDVRALLKQYGERKLASEISSAWQGGAYMTFRRKDNAQEAAPSTSDLGLLYISRWKTPQAADRYARFYTGAVSQRYHNATMQTSEACSGANCPVSISLMTTEEGPVIVERWSDNTVIVSESFDAETAGRLRSALRDGIGATRAGDMPQEEIGLRLLAMPAFRNVLSQIGEQMMSGLVMSQLTMK